MKLSFDPTSMESYREFIRLKSIPKYEWSGHSAVVPDEYSYLFNRSADIRASIPYCPLESLFDYQRDISRIGIIKKKFSVFAQCGLGKTLILLEMARHAAKSLEQSKSVMITSPLMVIPQTIEECERFYGHDDQTPVYVPSADLQSWMNDHEGSRIGITNYEAIRDGLDRGNVGGMFNDECFPAGTLVDTPHGPVAIEGIAVGDSILNASGVDCVSECHRREVPYAVKIRIEGTAEITCSPNHPIFTGRGWVCAQGVKSGDSIYRTRAAMRILRGDVSSVSKMASGRHSFLRDILLSEMENEAAAAYCENSQSDCCREEGGIHEQVLCIGRSSGCRNEKADCRTESVNQTRSSRKDKSCSSRNETCPPQTGRKWSRNDSSAGNSVFGFGGRLDLGICRENSYAEGFRISNLLQGGYCEFGSDDRDRSRRIVASGDEAEGIGQEKGCISDFSRVESVEILEQGHPELERLRESDGKLYFYDLGATRHPSFSVSGYLVHNSSTMKSAYGKWGVRLIELGRGLEWKGCFTGTPAPNDQIEYANHAVFMDHKKTVNEFLASYFVNRGQSDNRWEMKKHAVEKFYRDLSHWCIFLSNPATYGWKDNCGTIPPIHVHMDHIDLTDEQRRLAQALTGNLFTTNIGGIGQRGKLSQIAKGKNGISTNKTEYIRNLVNSWPNESTIIWVYYNDEQEIMERAFPDAGSIKGTTPNEDRIRIISDFKSGRINKIISKASVLGFGLNLQKATRHVFSGLQDSYEDYAQCVKRSNRIGSTMPLHVHIPVTELEEPMIANVMRKAHRVEQEEIEQERIFKKSSMFRDLVSMH